MQTEGFIIASDKVNFTSSILSDMTAKAAAFQDNKQPEQVVNTTKKQDSEPTVSTSAERTADKPKNNVKRNTIVGLSAVAILIGLGVAGRKGKLGPKLQKFLGGAEHATERNAAPERIKPQETKPSTEHTSSTGSTTNTDGGKVKLTREIKKRIAEIESGIDKDLPKIDEGMKTMKVYTTDECRALIKDEINYEAIDFSKCKHGKFWVDDKPCWHYSEKRDNCFVRLSFNEDKTLRQFSKRELVKGEYEGKDIFRITFDESGKNYYLFDDINKISMSSIDGSPASAFKKTDTHTIVYDKYGNISCAKKDVKTFLKHSIEYINGQINKIEYFENDAVTNPFPVKFEFFRDGKLYKQTYKINGKWVEIPLN